MYKSKMIVKLINTFGPWCCSGQQDAHGPEQWHVLYSDSCQEQFKWKDWQKTQSQQSNFHLLHKPLPTTIEFSKVCNNPMSDNLKNIINDKSIQKKKVEHQTNVIKTQKRLPSTLKVFSSGIRKFDN